MGASASVAQSAMAKASWRIIPLLGLGYLCSYLDRLNVSFAATQMNVDLKFSATVYGFGSGFFFLTYALLEIPSGLVMPRIGARRWIVRIMVSWGLISAGMMFIRTPLQFYIMRLLLEPPRPGFWPTCMFYFGELVSRRLPRAGNQPLLLLLRSHRNRRRHIVELAAQPRRPRRLARVAIAVPASKACRRSRSAWRCSGSFPTHPRRRAGCQDDERAWINHELAAENARLGAGKHTPRASRAARSGGAAARRHRLPDPRRIHGLRADRTSGPDDRHRDGRRATSVI